MNVKKILNESILIVLGAFLLALGLNTFLLPFKLSSGGISSIATILFYFFKVPLSVTNLLFNAVLMVFGYKLLGCSSVIKTIAGITLSSGFLQLTSLIPMYTEDLIIATIVGGIFVGAGVGIIVKQEASTGGSDFAALILHRLFPHISVATFIWIIDCTIIAFAGLVFGSITVTCYSALSLFISTKITDFICTIGTSAKAVQIISEKHAEIADEIMTKFERGVTGLYGKGMYTQYEKTTLLCVVSPKELPALIKMIKRIDPQSFVIITDAREVFGEGFKYIG